RTGSSYCGRWGDETFLNKKVVSGFSALHDVLTEQADGVGHVGAEGRSEDDLGNSSLCEILTLLLDHVGGSGNGEGVDLRVADEAADGLEVEASEGFLDLLDVAQIKSVALENRGRRACGDECGHDLCSVPGLLLVLVDGHGGVGTDVELLLARCLHRLLDDRDGDLEVLGVGRVDQGTLADLTGELEHLGTLGTDVDRNALLS